ncbi:transducin family protein / WD-40 repeat family protein [Wolffia australiana]
MDVNLGTTPFDLDFHPCSSVVAAGLINGYLQLYKYGADTQPQRLLEVQAHANNESCRVARFIDSGGVILTGSSDCSILATDVETGTPINRLENAHEHPVSRMVNLTEATIATGDDEGCIKVWDTRARTCCNSFSVHEDYISDMTFVPASMNILATSGDGTLSVNDLRKNKVKCQSEFSEDEPLSIAVMKNGRKVVCGTLNGVVLLYSWGFFKDCSDRFLLPAQSVNLVKLDEDTLIMGADDGIIRLVGVLPNRVIRPLGERSEDFPVEKLALSHDKNFLGSISHDPMLKIWDMRELLDGQHNVPSHRKLDTDDDDSNDDDEMDMDIKPPKSLRGGRRESNNASGSGFFAGL